jgi:glycosyltransferase involved in cell wall biosynthesis
MYCDIEALEDIKKIICENKIGIVQVEFFMLLDIIYSLPQNVKTVFVHHELAFVRHQTLMNNLKRKFVYDEYHFRKSFNEEILALNQYNCVITLSDVDKEKLKEAGVISKIEASPAFIPRKISNYPRFKITKHRLVYIASAKHYPNVEGLNWFIDNVHKRIIEKTQYQLDVIGVGWEQIPFRDIPANISFRGFIEDLSIIVPGSIMIVPILSGSGIRMKILESVNNSVPFVATTIGTEGLCFKSGESCYIADNSESFAECILDLMNDEEKQRRFVTEARIVYEQNYSPLRLANRRLKILKDMI